MTTISADTVLERLEAAQARLPDLSQRQYDLAEKSITDPSAAEQYDDVIAEMSATHAEVDRLRVALAEWIASGNQAAKDFLEGRRTS